MMTLRLMRFGAKGKPAYRIAVMDSRKPRQSKAKEIIGSYDPCTEPPEVRIDLAKAKFWLDRGAKPSATVKSLLAKLKTS
ncbi:MAG: 30S ribosomal protein S16 [Candidatus Aminicenantes bacterium]|nr:30S ribosomal protein S16 [Candidatus Aminicenantes bacterium]